MTKSTKMSMADKLKYIIGNPRLYIENFMRVANKNGDIVPFILNPQQLELLEGMDKHTCVLKSRQLGITTLACAYSIYLAQTNSNTTCLLVGYSIENATTIFEKLKQLYSLMPEPLKVKLIANNKKELKFENGSRIICAAAGTKDVARGSTLRFIHLSEFALWKDNADKQLLAIDQALTPNGILIIESTANGLNHFSTLWNKSERGENSYKNFFFGWISDHIMFAEEYKDYAQRYTEMHGGKALTVEELDDTEKDFYYKNNVSLQMLMWRRIKIADSSEDQFHQEFASNSLEAFVTTGSNIFNPTLVHERLTYVGEIPFIKERPSNLPTSLVQWFNRGLTLYGLPERGKRYYIGVDTGEGLGQDYSAIEIVSEDLDHIAEFKSNHIKPFQFAEIVNDIGIFYNKALLVVEKASAGHSVVDKLKNDYKYQNMYKYKEYDARGKVKRKVGFVTSSQSKQVLVNDYVELFETNQMNIKSKDLLTEMKFFTFKNGKMEAQSGNHDDLVMAMGLALTGVKSGLHYI